MPFISVERRSGYAGLFKDILVEVDGVCCARLARNGRAEFSVTTGLRSIRARLGDRASAPLQIALGDRERVGLVCEASGFFDARILLRKVYHTVARDRFRVESAAPQPDRRPLEAADHWSVVLGVAADAGVAEIRRAYLCLMKQCHPDLVTNLAVEMRAAAEQRSREINTAYAKALKFRAETKA